MRTEIRLLSVLFFTILTACGGGDAALNEPKQNMQAGLISQGSPGSSSVDIDALPAFPYGVPEEKISNSPKYNPSAFQSDNVDVPGSFENSIVETAVANDRVRMGGFTYTPYTPLGWIDDDVTRAYVFTFTGGVGANAYKPPPKPAVIPAPLPTPLRGLAAYRVVAVPTVVPAENLWPAPMAPVWREFMLAQMACWPICSMKVADVQENSPKATISLGAQPGSNLPSTGEPALDRKLYDPRWPEFHSFQALGVYFIVKAIDLKNERLDAAWVQLDKLLGREVTTGRQEYQYALVVNRDGIYPDVRYGAVTMKALDVWKYGTSLDPDDRYPEVHLRTLGLSMVKQTEGTRTQVLIQEKIKLIQYFVTHGELPPGNKIFK